MKGRGVRFLVIALPIISFLFGGGSVALQYARLARLKQEVKDANAELQRLSPGQNANPHDGEGHVDIDVLS